jgi:hypothetical protein
MAGAGDGADGRGSAQSNDHDGPVLRSKDLRGHSSDVDELFQLEDVVEVDKSNIVMLVSISTAHSAGKACARHAGPVIRH